MANLKVTVDLPPHINVVASWTKHAADEAEQAAEFFEQAKFFFERDIYDCRCTDSGEPVDGVFYDGPLRGHLLHGTEEDLRKGFITRDDPKCVREWALTPSYDLLHLPSRKGRERLFRLEGHELEVDTSELAYRALQAEMEMGQCTISYRTYHTRGTQGLHFVFFFRCMKWGGERYFYVDVSQYGYHKYHLFEGDLYKWAKDSGAKDVKYRPVDIHAVDKCVDALLKQEGLTQS